MQYYGQRSSVAASTLDPCQRASPRYVTCQLILTSSILLWEQIIKYSYILKGLIVPVLTGRSVGQINNLQLR
jgi:hypothetical protein